MGKRMKIALLLGEPDERDQNNFIEGFLKQIFGYNIDVCIFAMYQMYQGSANREIGDSKIFSLVPFDKFEAVVVMADTIQTQGVLEQLEGELSEYFKGAVLFVDKESKVFSSVGMDDYTLTKDIISHMIEEHGYNDIAYLTGKSWNIHAISRLQGYRDCMAEHGISINEDRIFYGDFWYTSGDSMVDKLLRNPDDLPEAIACANNCMAIGVANALEKEGIRVPEDIAVVGYDYSSEGAFSPSPLTSIYVPYEELGQHAADTIFAMLKGKELPEFDVHGELFIGNSCGCKELVNEHKLFMRDEWETDNLYDGFFAKYNPMQEDLMCQTKLKDLYNVISSYVYQIKGVKTFDLCLNKYWEDENTLADDFNDWKNYSDEMYLAVHYSTANSNSHLTGCKFKTQDLLPDMDKDRKAPNAFFFTPLFFEDKCMGYAVLSFGDEPRSYGNIYHAWISNVMRGLEVLRRYILVSNAGAKRSIYVDSATGLDNYKGLMKKVEKCIGDGRLIRMVVADIKGLAKINKEFGRDEGNRVIAKIGKCVHRCKTVELSCCLGNDEFLMVSFSEENDIADKMKEELCLNIEKLNKANSKYQIEICMGEVSGTPDTIEGFEKLINEAVSVKNGNKILEQKRRQEAVIFNEEEKNFLALVTDILDNNKFKYHFQPIINAKTGEIYSYEALMRSDTETFVSPLDILKYAGAINRLADVEKYTFVNVMSYIKENKSLFEGKKVFINSIPGVSLSDADTKFVNDELKSFDGQVVIELTEQAELGDDELATLKEKYWELGVEMAVDDYGTGYSNVTNLLRYMPRYVKIDRMLLSEIQNSPQKQHFVNEIIEFAHNNNIMALAEGVETVEELEMVIHLGADLIQGYYVARPNAEVLQTIPVKVKREVRQFNISEQYNKNKRLYVAGREFRISLAKLVSENYECILVTNEEAAYRDLSVIGVAGSKADVVLTIADGYHGRITLDNVSLGGKRGNPCITLGEECDVTLTLSGDNELRTGGICVPKGSKLRIDGGGSLDINCNFDNYFGIGNGMEQYHGDIIFEHEGAVEITGNGTLGVGIGSGFGGNISVNAGKIIVNVTGKRSAIIGCISGDTNIEVSSCDISLIGSIFSGVGIGSKDGRAEVNCGHVAISMRLNGNEVVAIGSQMAHDNVFSFHDGSTDLSIHAPKTCGIGSFKGKSDISIKYAAVNMSIEGEKIIAAGDFDKQSSFELHHGEINADFITMQNEFIGISKDKLVLDNGRLNFKKNGDKVEAL